MRLPLPILLAVLAAALGMPALGDPPAAQPGGKLIELPPLIVNGEDGSAPVPWRYASAPGTEVLSLCDDDTTTRLMRAIARLHAMLPALIPTEFQAQHTMPEVYILFSDDGNLQRYLSPAVIAAMGSIGDPLSGKSGKVQLLPNLSLPDYDGDDLVDFVIVPTSGMPYGSPFGVGSPSGSGRRTSSMEGFFAGPATDDSDAAIQNLELSPNGVRSLLERRTPPLPRWCIEGIMGLFAKCDFTGDKIRVAPDSWLGSPYNSAIRREETAARPLLPLPELFAPPPAASPDPAAAERAQVWLAESELFARWAWSGGAGRWRAYWRLVDKSVSGPVTDEAFRRCFGFGMADMRDILSDYIASAMDDSFEVDPGKLPQAPDFACATATAAQVARIKGDWERLEAEYVKERSPQYASLYSDQAVQTLHRSYDKGDRDPLLLAVLGLCETEAGRDQAARGFLQDAVRGGVVHPRAYMELAHIELFEAEKRFSRPDADLAPADERAILEILDAGRRLKPPLPGTYAILSEVFMHSATPPSDNRLDELEQGSALFPSIPVLSYRAAIFDARAGRMPEALTCIDRALAAATDEPSRRAYEKVRDLIVSVGPALDTPEPPGR